MSQKRAIMGRVINGKVKETAAANSGRIAELIDIVKESEFQFMAYYIGGTVRANYDVTGESDIPPIQVADAELSSCSLWSQFICGRVSPWIDPDHPNGVISERSTRAFKEELAYCAYLGLKGVMVAAPRLHRCPRLMQIIHEALWIDNIKFKIWIVIPTSLSHFALPPESSHNRFVATDDFFDESHSIWLAWRRLRTKLFNHHYLSVCLLLTEDLDDEFVRPSALERWRGEHITGIQIDSQLFVNSKTTKMLTLTPAHRAVVLMTQSIRPEAQMMLSTTLSSNPYFETGPYRQALQLIYENRAFNQVSDIYKYEDNLLVPLQPLADNLESNTYETFEQDPIKYVAYRRAIASALRHLIGLRSAIVDSKVVHKLNVMVLGAGRGPLVAELFAAEREVESKGELCNVTVVEKNPNSCVTLRYRNATEWRGRVELVHSDMRDVVVAEDQKADLIISELLGSFGDNELSPECLDGANSLLKSDGISVPRSYTSYLCPISSAKIMNNIFSQPFITWNAAQFGRHLVLPFRELEHFDPESDVEPGPQIRTLNAPSDPAGFFADMPYVVQLQSCAYLADPQPIYTYDHPNRTRQDRRYQVGVTFIAKDTCEITGFAGYFSCELWPGETLSILPATHTPRLQSWFPVYFPLRGPILVERGQKMHLELRREADEQGVWYEWRMTEPVMTDVQNKRGCHFFMRIK